MLLAVDVGNTQTHLGLWSGDELAHTWRIATRPLRTTDDLAVQLDGLLALRDLDTARGDARSSCPRPCRCSPLSGREWARARSAVDTLLIGPGVRSGMPILMDNPREVGPDRIVNAVAALARAGGPCIAVDFGTSTNFDAVSAERRVRGRRARAGRRDLDGGALRSRGAALARRVRRAADRDRPQHRARAAERRRLRLRRAGGRHRAAHARRARRQPPACSRPAGWPA